MRNFEIEKRLEELKNYKVIKITMDEGISFCIPYENIVNHKENEMLTSDNDNFCCFYSSIFSINPSE